MKPRPPIWIAVSVCFLIWSQLVRADWYEIEVLVFARSTASGDERPNRASDLSYPADTRTLQSGPAEALLGDPVDAPRWLSVGQLWGELRHEALYTELLRNQAELFSRDALPPWLAPEDELSPAEESDDNAEALSDSETDVEVSEALVPLAVERSYVALDTSHWALRAEAQRLTRSNHQILWHAAWRQNLPDRAKGAAIAVISSDAPGATRSLQGSLRISRTRFLHLDTDLWLSVATSPEQASLTPPPPLPAGIDPRVAEDLRARFANAVLADQGGFYWESAPAARPVSERAIAVHRLQEQRRARSEELHYLDHPQFGLVFIARPYQFKPWFSEESSP